ncbi:MAG: protease modulator HflC, partial [Rickettsiales bacterium]
VIALVALAIVTLNSLFIVGQTEQALVLEFGKAMRVENEPGLKAKVPFIQNVIYFDKRLLDFNAEPKEINASDQKRVIIDAFIRYQITNPLQFYQTVYNERGVRDRLNDILESSLKKVVGSYPLNALLSPTRSVIMDKILYDVNRQASGKLDAAEEATDEEKRIAELGGFGVDVVDVRIKRADLPEANSNAIYDRMRTEREQEAKELRAQGEKQATIIRSNAERARTEILAEARNKAEVIRGEGDAVATKTYAEAFNRDQDFYDFYRTLQAYRAVLKGDDTTMVLTPDSDFLKYLGESGQ